MMPEEPVTQNARKALVAHNLLIMQLIGGKEYVLYATDPRTYAREKIATVPYRGQMPAWIHDFPVTLSSPLARQPCLFTIFFWVFSV